MEANSGTVNLAYYNMDMYFKDILPEFIDEIGPILDQMGRSDLSSQLRRLEIVQRCPCSDMGCASMKVSASTTSDSFETPGPRRSFFTKSLELKDARGKIKLSLDQLGRITAFEILNRPDVRRQLFKRR
jgi:hypothetical protein